MEKIEKLSTAASDYQLALGALRNFKNKPI
jgi:hypothetical protein